MKPVELSVPSTAGVGELTLRPWCDQDLDALVEAYRDPVLQRWTGIPVTDGPEARRWLDAQQCGWRSAERLSFAVDERSAVTGDSRLVANVVLKLVRREHGHAEVGYWTAAPGRGGVSLRGPSTRSVRGRSRRSPRTG